MIGHVPEIAGHHPETIGHVRPKYPVTNAQLWDGAHCPMPDERRHVTRIWSSLEETIVADDMTNVLERLACVVVLEAMLDAIATKEKQADYWGLSDFLCSRRLMQPAFQRASV
jgi:hypothetical protein